MGNGMNKVLPGLYVGNYRDSKDQQQLDKFQITHIVAIHDSPRRLLPDKHYLCVMAADTPDQNLSQYFSVCNDFIHAARLREGNVLIHCLAGMSRSVTVAVAYIMSVTNLNWKEALKVVRAGRAVANPNVGFQTQLQEFDMFRLADERRRLKERFPSTALDQSDRSKCVLALDNYQELLQNKDICEGNCSRGEKCPTGKRNFGVTNPKEACGSPCNNTNENTCKNSSGGLSYALYFIVENWRTLRTDSKAKEGDLSHPTGKPLMENVVYYCPSNQSNAEEYPGDNEPSTSNSYPKPVKKISSIRLSESPEGSIKSTEDFRQSHSLSVKTRNSIDRMNTISLENSPQGRDSVLRRNTNSSMHSQQSRSSLSRRNTIGSGSSQQSQSSTSRRNTVASTHSIHSQSSVSQRTTIGSLQSQRTQSSESEKRRNTVLSEQTLSEKVSNKNVQDENSQQK